jgi:hypothetical protein
VSRFNYYLFLHMWADKVKMLCLFVYRGSLHNSGLVVLV